MPESAPAPARRSLGDGGSPAVRTVVVCPPEASRETLGVFRAIGTILIVGYFAIGLRRGGDEVGTALEPYQALFRRQPAEVQRVVRDLLSGLEEMTRLRTPAGEWPTVERLASELVPPFTQIPGRAPDYRWECRRHNTYINYLGTPASAKASTGASGGADRPTFLLFIQEPEAEIKDVSHLGQALLDESHRRLADGTVLHVSIWFHPDPKIPKPLVWLPAQEGWTQIVTGAAPVK